MKIVFSRKGFDSASGGCPSPILPDGSLLSLPIPDRTRTSPSRYRDLVRHGHNLGELVARLAGSKERADSHAHLDPDLIEGMRPREKGWRPAFGQCAAAQGHLRRQAVGVGDVFLFWGLFRRVDENLRWTGPRLHVIWGWLRIGQVARVDRDVKTDPKGWQWAAGHPHLAFRPDPSNTLYVAADAAGASDGPGAGVFASYADELRLTAPGGTRASDWSLPSWMLPRGRPPMTYHGDPSRWSERDGGVDLRIVGRGQEFVLDAEHYPQSRAWLRRLCGRPARPLMLEGYSPGP